MSRTNARRRRFVVCINAVGNDDLQTRRIYEVLPDALGARSKMLRVIDDSGDDYLYPSRCFLPVPLPASVREAIKSRKS